MPRDIPYSQFNFLVSWAAAPGSEGAKLSETEVKAGFQEVGGLGLEITVAEYRPGNAPTNGPQKITTMFKVPDITLKRGVIGERDLWDWIKAVRDGSQKSLKTVTIKLLGEDRDSENPAQEWELKRARPMKYTGPALNGKGTDVAIEELVLACEEIDLK
ncbi:MAG: phage tail protein [Myxococcales bacterium]|nr:phage tail protein [Myxococcales bacterium]MCA9551542.1 phage tail protein [Myxococcales bacterium]